MDSAQKQVSLLFSMVFGIIFVIILLYLFDLFKPTLILLVVLVGMVIIYIKTPTFFVQLHEYERAVIFRKGKFREVYGPGWKLLLPFIDTYRKVDLRVKTADIPSQEVVTKDNIKLKLDAIMYIKVIDAKSAIINIENYQKSAISNIQASLRSVVGKMELSEVISNVDMVGDYLKKETEKVAEEWGVDIADVEIQSITLPDEVQKAMHRLKESEQRKLAAKELAEGTKIRLDAVQEAASKFSDPTLKYMYLQSLNKIAEGKSTKIIFPMELSRLATGIASKFGGSYSKVQEEVLHKYEDMHQAGMKPKSIIEKLQKDYDVELPKKKPKKTKKG